MTGWVDNLGYAMIEKLQFMVGHHEVEVLTGEHLNIINELMRDDKSRHNFSHTLRTGRPLARHVLTKSGHPDLVWATGASSSDVVTVPGDRTGDILVGHSVYLAATGVYQGVVAGGTDAPAVSSSNHSCVCLRGH